MDSAVVPRELTQPKLKILRTLIHFIFYSKGRTLSVFECRELRKVFGPQREEAIGDWKVACGGHYDCSHRQILV